MDAALAGGLPSEMLSVLVEARAHWHATGRLATGLPLLSDAVSHPAAAQWDAVFVAAARKLSASGHNVRP
jgi:hypothetical protein